MNILLDTNLLSRLAEIGHPQFQIAFDSTTALQAQGHDLVIVPQVLYEFWVVCTRPTALNGLVRTVVEAQGLMARFKSLCKLLPESQQTFAEWEKLVTNSQIVGKNAHDARLVAMMGLCGVTHILTFNDKDFNRFQHITVLTPAKVINPSANP